MTKPTRRRHDPIATTRTRVLLSIERTDLEIIDAAADRAGLDRSSFLRMAALERARAGQTP